ncbi:MFS transporter [Mycobacterium angelicum]|uniref:Major facilitator superfamily (MFS) profile domain-containing protein n=1 Tax=Mycobacterium angelicum TaxID=470074 RepID=A0A1W9Z7G8_MYCAN|nr:MFS transporter [Mycobacterium angelicum]MCV7195513.1 MFS transporter [Mycobacterium angelicum]ORA08579.1 hypothetical protein BST12_28305 [Mycobacterium angelicum]
MITGAAIPRVIRLLLGGFVLTRAAGFAPLFLSYHVVERSHGSAVVGAALASLGIGSLVGQLACGWLADRLGRRKTITLVMVLGAPVLFLLAKANTPTELLAGAAVVGFTYDAPHPVLSATMCDLIPDPGKRGGVDAWRFGCTSLGAVIAGGIGGVVADRVGTPILFIANGLAYAAFAGLVVCRIPATGRRPAVPKPQSYRKALSDKGFLLLLISSVSTWAGAASLVSTVPLLMHYRGLDVGDYGWTAMASALAVVTLTPLMAPWLSRRVADRPRLDILAVATGWVTMWMALTALAHSVLAFCAMVALAAPGEIAWFVVAPGIVHRIAPSALRGRYHGMWGSSFGAAAVASPLLASSCLAHGGPVLLSATSVAAGLIGAALCLPLHRVLGAGCRARPHSISGPLPRRPCQHLPQIPPAGPPLGLARKHATISAPRAPSSAVDYGGSRRGVRARR